MSVFEEALEEARRRALVEVKRLKYFMVSCLVCFGSCFGMLVHPMRMIDLGDVWVRALIDAHSHLMTVGFVGLMIFGVRYHIILRFMAKQLYSNSVALTSLGFMNVGIAIRIAFELIKPIICFLWNACTFRCN